MSRSLFFVFCVSGLIPLGCGDDAGTGATGAGATTWSGGNGGMGGAAAQGGGGAAQGGGGAAGGEAPQGGGGEAPVGGGGTNPGGGGAGGETAGGGGAGGEIAGGGGAGGEGGTGGSPAAWRQTITVDGNIADWPQEARFTNSASTNTYIAWDDTMLYLAVTHPDVQTGGPQHWVLAYVGNGSTGTTTGVTHNTQTPTLPFDATFLVRSKMDESFSSLETWTGATWLSSTPLFGTGGAVRVESGASVEMGIPLSTLAITDQLDIVMTLIFEGNGSETTYGATPATAISNGSYDPNYAKFWRFDRTSPLPPTSYTPMP